jgi:membrane associated rhomboid family serine protease
MNDITSINTFLIILIVIISFVAFNNDVLFSKLKHYPYLEKRERSYFRWITCAFLHGDFTHLFVNVFVLFSFGGLVEKIYDELYGPVAYFFIFLVILVGSSIPSYFKHKDNPTYASVGASGVISGIVFISILYFPTDRIYLFGVIPIPSFIFGVLYLWYSWYASKSSGDRIDHSAHLYGALAGLLTGILLDQSWLPRWQFLIP